MMIDKLNEYLQTLVSSSSYELRLEPNKNPYIVSVNGQTDVATEPLPGPQISMMVFPLIPDDVRTQLPTSQEIQFVHPHNLGKFTFTVAKSPGGFIVTILLGIVGALVGGFLGRLLGLYEPGEPAGFIGAFVGAVLCLWIYRKTRKPA